MKRITIDEELKNRFDDFSDDFELCDADGNVIAKVQRSTPWNDPDNWLPLTPGLSPEEWKRLSESDERGISTQEMFRQLQEQG